IRHSDLGNRHNAAVLLQWNRRLPFMVLQQKAPRAPVRESESVRDTVLMDESPAVGAGGGDDAVLEVRRLLVIHNPTAGGRRAPRLRAV
ncbi:hypothetical protein ABTO68_19425, partial [Acinetobacter baumannii]